MTDEHQTDFYQHRNWLETSEGKTPAFWISKFRIYPDLVEPESDPIRAINLKRGLNIIWSPPAEEEDHENEKGRGHAAGKSAFCRALRYLLGEKTYGNSFIEGRLLESLHLHTSYLAAEVWIGEIQWCVFRPLNKRRKDFALKGLSIEQARSCPPSERLEYSEFSNALEAATVAQWPVNHFDNGQTDPITWLHLLESLSRDQESHLSGIHNWRSPNSSSEPKDTSESSRAFLMRCLLGLADSLEPEILAERASLLEKIKTAETTVTTYTRVFNDSVSALQKSFPKLPSNIKPEDEIFVPAVQEEIGKTIATDQKKLRAKVAELQIEALETKIQETEKEANTITGRIQERQEHLEKLVEDRKSFLSKPPTEKVDDSDICEQIRRSLRQGDKVCGVAMEVAQTECQLFWRCGTDKLKATPDPNPVTETKEVLLANLDNKIRLLTRELAPSEQAITAARKQSVSLNEDLVEKRKKRDELLQEITRLPLDESSHMGTAHRIQDALLRQHDARMAIDSANKKRKQLDDQLKGIRERKATEQGERSTLFDQIIKRLVNESLTGELSFAAVETRAILKRNGVLESEAYKALRCLAYDFTGLIAALNGVGNHPGFILHDSPRESDMEPSLYRPIFELISDLESRLPDSFQYIVTTTEPPPKQLQKAPHLRATLSSANATSRLYGADL